MSCDRDGKTLLSDSDIWDNDSVNTINITKLKAQCTPQHQQLYGFHVSVTSE